MKSAFANCVKLSHILPGVKYRLQTDASNLGISGILYQCDQEGNQYIISLVSRCLNMAEQNYATTEKELLAIVYSVTTLRTYLIGTRFEIITDHKGLTFLNSTVHLNARLIRWSIILQQYDFEISYCAGKDNIVADFFSRNPRGKFEDIQNQNNLTVDVLERELVGLETESDAIDLGLDLQQSLKNLAVLQRQDIQINLVIQKLENNKLVDFYILEKEILFRHDRYSDV